MTIRYDPNVVADLPFNAQLLSKLFVELRTHANKQLLFGVQTKESLFTLGLSFLYLQIIMAQEEILVKEKELNVARRKLENIRKAKYKDRPLTSEDEDSGSAF